MLEGIRMIVLLVSLFLCAWIDWKTERVSVPLLLLGGMTAVLLHLFAQEESVFYLMTGMSVGIVLLLYSLVTHESIGYGDGCLFVMTGLFLGFWENLDAADPGRDQRGASAYAVQGRDSGHKGRGGCREQGHGY